MQKLQTGCVYVAEKNPFVFKIKNISIQRGSFKINRLNIYANTLQILLVICDKYLLYKYLFVL